MLVIGGYIIVIVSVFGGFALAGGHLSSLLQPVELLMIGGAAVGAFLVGNSGKAIKATLKTLPTVLQGSRYSKAMYMDLMALLYDVLAKVRKEGLMTIESDVENPEQSPLFAKYPSILADHHILEFITDYLRLMAYTGARRDEALRLRWADVDFERGLLTVGADGLAKNHDARAVDLHPKLEAHLREMHARRAPDSQWLFPSPQRGTEDAHAKTFKESLNLARKASGLPDFTNHDCRHFFISYCIMSGIDFMTIARWVGHKDGGVLIGKVYGHLSNEHAKQQAQRINFGPQTLLTAVA